MSRIWKLLGLAALGLTISACGATAPSSMTGTWTGTWTDPIAGPAAITTNLTQTGSAITGNWSILFSGGTPVTGSISGTINGTDFEATFTPDNTSACTRLVSTTVDKNSMKGAYAYSNCSILETGAIQMTQQ